MEKTVQLLIIIVFCTHFNSTGQERSPVKKNAIPILISNEFKFTEGPASNKMGDVYFTDQPNNRILKWEARKNTISVFMENAGRSNGLYFDDEENLWACADENFQLWKISPDKQVSVVLDDFKGKNFNGPNDLWIDGQGGIYFTDPYYQRDYWERKTADMDKRILYYLSPDHKKVEIAAEGFVLPNGIIGSAKDKILYVADRSENKTYRFSINEYGKLSERVLFAEIGSDGMTIDSKGNVYFTGDDGVTILDKNGNKIDHIKIDKDWTGNVTFGGKNQDILFITASDAVYTLQMKTHGIRWNK